MFILALVFNYNGNSCWFLTYSKITPVLLSICISPDFRFKISTLSSLYFLQIYSSSLGIFMIKLLYNLFTCSKEPNDKLTMNMLQLNKKIVSVE
jgi:hypothetical protein